MQKRLTLLLALLILCGLLLAPLTVYAQEEGATAETPTTEEVASGLPVLILLLGVAAVVAVGGYMVRQSRSQEDGSSI